MILHLAEDEKFIDVAIKVFEEAYPNKNVYFIELPAESLTLKQTKSKHPNIIAAHTSNEQIAKLIASLHQYDAVILHNFYNPYKQKIVAEAAININFHWMSWGADIYNYIPKLSRKLYVNKHKKPNPIEKNFNSKVGDIISFIVPNLWYNWYLKPKGIQGPNYYKKSVQKINSVSTIIPTEVSIIKKYLNKQITYLPFKYGSIEDLALQDNALVTDNNFLIGNSAHASSNHIDAFEKVSKIVDSQKIVVPLSYGDTQNKQIILKKGHEMFGERFNPLLDFMPIKDYTQILLTCGNVVMNHNRQQGMGNVIISLWQGARVFLNKENPAYGYFKSIGVKVFKVSEVHNYKNLMSFEELAAHNRPILKRIYSYDQVLKETKELVKHLCRK